MFACMQLFRAIAGNHWRPQSATFSPAPAASHRMNTCECFSVAAIRICVLSRARDILYNLCRINPFFAIPTPGPPRVETIDTTIRSLIDDLLDTMHAGPGSVGVAAPQSVFFLRVCVVDVSASRHGRDNNHGQLCMIDPEIIAGKGVHHARRRSKRSGLRRRCGARHRDYGPF